MKEGHGGSKGASQELGSQGNNHLKEQGSVRRDGAANNPLVEQNLYDQDIPHEQLVIVIKNWLLNNRESFKGLYAWAKELEGPALNIAILREEIYSKFTLAALRTYQKQGTSAEYLKNLEEPEASFLHILNAWDCANYHRYSPPIQSEARQGKLRQILPIPHIVILNQNEGKLFDAMAKVTPLPDCPSGQRMFLAPPGLIE